MEKLYNGWEKVINFLKILLEWYLRLNKNKFMEKDSKY